MATRNYHSNSHKQWPALLAAFVITLVLGLAMAALGLNALVNQNSVPIQTASALDQTLNSDPVTDDQAGSLIAQYQAREQQYQTQLQQAADQLNTANAQLQQYQSLVSALQQAGVIQITSDGRVFVSRGGFGEGEFNGD